MSINNHTRGSGASQSLERAHTNQARLVAALRPHYDFVVCGAGSSGSVVARRLAAKVWRVATGEEPPTKT